MMPTEQLGELLDLTPGLRKNKRCLMRLDGSDNGGH